MAKPVLLDTRQAAEYLHMSVSTLNNWRITDRYPLAYVKIGKNVFYTEDALLKFIELRTVKPEEVSR